MKQKQDIAILFVLFLCLTLGACASAGPKGPDWDENILVYAHTNPYTTIDRDKISEFNSTHAEVQIEFRDYTDEDGIDRLLTEIITGNIPDIMELNHLPYRKMIQKGYLENLWPYIENDPDLGREGVMEAPLKANEVNGGLYSIFRKASINTLVGPERIVGNHYSWTMDDLQEAFASMPEGSTITDFCATKVTMFNLIFRMLLDSYVDWNTGKCSFDSESFQNALEFVNSFPSEFESMSETDIMETLVYRRTHGLEMLSMLGIFELYGMQAADIMYGEKTSFVGYPVGDDSIGSSFQTSEMYAMSSVCRQKAAAWEYMRSVLLPVYDTETMREALDELLVSFPVNRADYDMMVRTCMQTSESGYRRHITTTDGTSLELPPISKEELARFEDFYNRIDKIDFCDETIYNIVWEQCAPYFAGDRTLDETIAQIQNRVSLYVNEQM